MTIKKSFIFILFFFFFACTCDKNSPDLNNNSSNNSKLDDGKALQELIETSSAAPAPCEKDADCVLVSSSCCGCSAGGDSIAVHKSQVDNYNNNLQQICSPNIGRLCPQWYRCNDFEARCQSQSCTALKGNP